MKNLFSIPVVILLFFSCSDKSSNGIRVKNISEYNDAVSKAQPGDNTVLANGVWKDTELVFEGKGTDRQDLGIINNN